MFNKDGMLSLFKEQLEHESMKLAEQLSLVNRGQHLIWWYFSKLRGFRDSLIEEIVCDGGGDLGLDAIHIDDDNIVHFYQFKNPERIESSFPAGEIDKTISGLNMILSQTHSSIANRELKSRIEEIYQSVSNGYQLHIVTSGNGDFSQEAKVKLQTFVDNLCGPSDSYFKYIYEDLRFLQDSFYTKNLPTVSESIKFTLDYRPYMVRSAEHDCYMFHLRGVHVAELYERFGEKLLQQNIRVSQGNTTTNNSIYDTCVGEQSGDFFHYNNGITFLCETAQYDDFTRCQKLDKAQIVNGGQTIRTIHFAFNEGKLQEKVMVPVRVITSQGNKDFSNNVAVNLNNQNRMESSFLRSNNPRIIQLSSSLASIGWYLERRDGEVDNFTEVEKTSMEAAIGKALDGAVINLKEGTQAYVATYFRQPEIAKKNPGKMFLSINEGGQFERIFSSEISAEKFAIAQQIKWEVDSLVKNFAAYKRKKTRSEALQDIYKDILADDLVDEYGDELDQVIPQCAIFLCAILFEKYVRVQKMDPKDFLSKLKNENKVIMSASILKILAYAKGRHAKSAIKNKTWPTLLKSQAFFEQMVKYFQQ